MKKFCWSEKKIQIISLYDVSFHEQIMFLTALQKQVLQLNNHCMRKVKACESLEEMIVSVINDLVRNDR